MTPSTDGMYYKILLYLIINKKIGLAASRIAISGNYMLRRSKH
jgi:hypothetical protein